MNRKTDIQELSSTDLDRVSGGELRALVVKVQNNMAQKEMIRKAQAELAAMK